MTELFYKLLELSFSASWVVLAVLAARLVLKKAPRWIHCSLWGLVALRLLCPVSPESTLSLVPDVAPSIPTAEQEIPEQIQKMEFLGEPGTRMTVSYTDDRGDDQIAEVYQDPDGTVVMASTTEPPRQPIAPSVWLGGMALMAIYAAVSYLRLRKRVGASMELGNGVFLCDYIDTPFILGIVRPRIYLPSDMDPTDAQHVLAHERSHLKRKDHWWKPLGYLLLCIHWFNPLLWAAYLLLCRDIELACDEKVIKELGSAEKKTYSEALLRCTVSRKMILACPLAFGEVGVKQRIKSILSYKKPGFWILLLSLLVTAAVAVGFLTDPERDTLSDLYTGDREAVTCIDLWSDEGQCCLGTPNFLEDAWTLLDEVEYDPTQLLTAEFTEESYLQTVSLNIGEERTKLYLSKDFTQVIPQWDPAQNADGVNYQYYPVRSPERLEAFFKKHIATVYNREVTAAPFAQMGQPYQWMQGLTEEALYEVRLGYSRNESSSIGGYLAKPAFEELLPLLKAIPEDALVNPEIIGEAGSDHITTYYSSHPNLAVSFQDRANDLGVVVRYYEEMEGTPHLEFLMIDGAYTVARDNYAYIRPVQKWDIESPTLLKWFQEAAPLPPYGSLRYGHWMDYDEDRGYIVVSDGETTIKVRSFVGWTYEVVEPSEDSDNFGVRIRHPEQTEGWIYVSFWPEGYENTEINRYFSSAGCRYTSLPLQVLYPNGMDTEDGIWYEQVDWYENGDFVIRNEGADHWFEKYAEEIRVQTTYTYIEAGEHVMKEPPEMVVDLDYTQCEDPHHGFKQFDLETADRAYMSLSGSSSAVPCGWMYDDTPEGENVLFTYWPEYMTEGMVNVEYHEGFFQPPEGMTVEETGLHIDAYGGEHPAYRGTLPGDDHWSYLWIDRKNGSYVFRFENTEHWDERRVEECLWALHTFQFQG